MRREEWTSSPAWNCFRTDFQRHWRTRSILKALALFGLIVAVQLAISLAFQATLFRAARGWLGWMLMFANQLGLYSPLAIVFRLPSTGVLEFRMYLILLSLFSLFWLACHFLMPAYAANSIAPDRERRRLHELILAGLTPRQILLAKGLAGVLPFLGLGAAGFLGSAAAYALIYWSRIPSFTRFEPSLTVILIFSVLLPLAGLLLRAAVLVCISALSRRASTALVLCYGVECLLLPAISAGSSIWLQMSPRLGWTWRLIPQFVPLLVLAVAVSLLWPRAKAVLAYPDEEPSVRQRRPPVNSG